MRPTRSPSKSLRCLNASPDRCLGLRFAVRIGNAYALLLGLVYGPEWRTKAA